MLSEKEFLKTLLKRIDNMKSVNQALKRIEEINEQIEDFYEHQKTIIGKIIIFNTCLNGYILT